MEKPTKLIEHQRERQTKAIEEHSTQLSNTNSCYDKNEIYYFQTKKSIEGYLHQKS